MKSKHRFTRFLTVSTALGLALCAGIAQAQTTTYKLTDLGVIPSVPTGETMIYPAGINNAGEVVGSSVDFALLYHPDGSMVCLGTLPDGVTSNGYAINTAGDVSAGSGFESDLGDPHHAALFQNDGMKINLGVLLGWGLQSFGYGLNDARQVVGASGTPPLNTHAFIWNVQTGLTDLGTLGGQYAQAFSINNSGLVAGAAQIAGTSGASHAFLWDAVNKMRDIGTIAGNSSSAVFINQAGHAVGDSTINTTDTRTHAFFYDGTTMKDLGSLGSSSTVSDISHGFGVNDTDDVVGSTYRPFTGGSLYQTAFIYSNGVMSELEKMVDSSGSDYRLLTATAINDVGQITVQALKVSTNTNTAVLLTPTTAATDTVTITAASYVTRRKALQVQATDSDRTATLQVFVTSTNTLIGSLTKSGRKFSGTFPLTTNPENITVTSNLGGSATAAVTTK